MKMPLLSLDRLYESAEPKHCEHALYIQVAGLYSSLMNIITQCGVGPVVTEGQNQISIRSTLQRTHKGYPHH